MFRNLSIYRLGFLVTAPVTAIAKYRETLIKYPSPDATGKMLHSANSCLTGAFAAVFWPITAPGLIHHYWCQYNRRN